MGTHLLYQKDSYLKSFEATVVSVEEGAIVLDATAFMPRSGGLDGDRGTIAIDGTEYAVTDVRFGEGGVLHYVDPEPSEEAVGKKAKCTLDWNRRYRMMRLHTAAHILSALFHKKANALITGGHITPERAYDDYSLQSLNQELINSVFDEANGVVEQALPVKIYWLPREEALKIPSIVKLANKMPPSLREWRIVEIPGVDIQADGGVHVKNTREIGEIVFLEAKNKGKNRKRVYFTVKP